MAVCRISTHLGVIKMKFLTSHGNSRCQVADVIQTQARIHWYWGLRQAELFIEQKCSDLVFAERQVKKMAAHSLFLKDKLIFYKNIHSILRIMPIIGTWLNKKIVEMDIELEALNDQQMLDKLSSQIRDCQMEMAVAEKEYQKILADIPEISQLSYEQIQEISIEALVEKKAFLISASHIGSLHQLSENAATLLAEAQLSDISRLIESEWHRVVEINSEIAAKTKGLLGNTDDSLTTDKENN
jgi:hypothetical protein